MNTPTPHTPQARGIDVPGRFELKAGTRFVIQTAGVGGYGDLREREEAAIVRDRAEGYVSLSPAAEAGSKS